MTAVIVIVVVLAVLLVLFLVSAIRVMREYERAIGLPPRPRSLAYPGSA